MSLLDELREAVDALLDDIVTLSVTVDDGPSGIIIESMDEESDYRYCERTVHEQVAEVFAAFAEKHPNLRDVEALEDHEGEWWCPKCQEWIPGTRVNYDETCDTCGCPVLTEDPEARLDAYKSAPVICPDVRGVRCMAYWLPLGAFPETKALCLATSKDAVPGQLCPCVKEET